MIIKWVLKVVLLFTFKIEVLIVFLLIIRMKLSVKKAKWTGLQLLVIIGPALI